MPKNLTATLLDSRKWCFFGASAFLIAAIIFSLYVTHPWQVKQQLSVSKSLQICTDSNSTDATVACARAVIGNLLKSYSTQDLMESIATGTLPEVFHGCHGVGHIIGDQTFQKTGSLEDTLAACTNDCDYACIHGAVGAAVSKQLGATVGDEDIAHASGSEIEQIGQKYCDSSPALCHGLGHVLFIADNSNFNKALTGCNVIATGTRNEVCDQGVFMQGAGGVQFSLDSEGAPTADAPIKSNDYAYPCDVVPAQYSHPCFQYLTYYQSPLFDKNGATSTLEKFEIAIGTCDRFTGSERINCIEGLGRDARPIVGFQFSTDDFIHACESLPTTDEKNACILGKVHFMTQYAEPFATTENVCLDVESDLQTQCYNELFQMTISSYTSGYSTICQNSTDLSACESRFEQFKKIQSTLPNYVFGLYGKQP